MSYSWPSAYSSLTWEVWTIPAIFNLIFLNSWSVLSNEILFWHPRCRICKSRLALVGEGVRVDGENFVLYPQFPSYIQLPPCPCPCPRKPWKLLRYFEDPSQFHRTQCENFWILQLFRSLSNVTFTDLVTLGFRMLIILPVFVNIYSWRGRLRPVILVQHLTN